VNFKTNKLNIALQIDSYFHILNKYHWWDTAYGRPILTNMAITKI